MDFESLKAMKFEYVGNLYKDKSLFSRVDLHPYRVNFRVYYHLPDGSYTYFYSVPPLKSKKEKEAFLAEFCMALTSGFLPKSGATKLRQKNFDPKIGEFEIFFKKYFNQYSTGARAKLDESKKTQKTVSRAVMKYFMEKNIDSICQITDEHLKEWESDLLLRVNKNSGKPLAGSSRNSYRKCFRAFLNTAKEHKYPLQCDPGSMNIYEHTKGGEIDEKADARHILYPLALIEAVERCSYPLDLNKQPDMRKIIRLWREIGTRTGEMLSFGESNIEFRNGYPINLHVQEIPEIGFKPKTEISKREIPLTDSAGDYILSLIKKFDGVKRYGKHKNEIVEFPYLIVFKDRKGNWVRNDDQFKKLFKEITQHAIKEFNLPYTEDYIPYDLRRSCNLFLRKEQKLNLEGAAARLGHSKETNIKHYTLDEDNKDINNVQIQKGLEEAMNSDPETKKMYSRHLKKENASAVVMTTDAPKKDERQTNHEGAVSFLENDFSSLQTVGCFITKLSSEEEDYQVIASS